MTQVLTSLSEAMAETVAKGGLAVVRVDGRDRLPASGIVWSADGVVVTAHHVVERDDNISVGLPDGQTAPATLVGRDPSTDLAVLRVQSAGLATPEWDEPDSLRVGHIVLALGRPGQSVRATMGIISALGQAWQTATGGTIDRYIQTDLVMYPGFSGGPLVGADSKVLGLNTSALLRGVSLAVPAPTVRQVVEALLAHGHIRRGYLGIGLQPIRLSADLAGQVEQESGLLVVSVEPDSPAQEGHLFQGDTIIGLAGQPVRHLDDLWAALSGDRIGSRVPARIIRGGQVQELMVTVGERAQASQQRQPRRR